MYNVVVWACTYMITMFLAYGLKKLGIFQVKDRKIFANLIFNVTLPAMLVSSFSTASVDLWYIVSFVLGLLVNVLMLTAACAISAKKSLDLKGIYDFAREGDIAELIPYIDRQIQYNKAISEEGIKNQYGANVGKSILKHRHHEIREVAKAYAAAGSDARMAGCELPVVINSGSGNQGITVSVPVVKYAEYLGVSDEKLYRALILSNLVAIHIKRGIGKLSAFCGVVGAACGAGSV